MNAVKMLKLQHQEVEELFEEFAKAESVEPRREAFNNIADALAVHATIEERHFYPGVKQRQTQEILLESVEEHLEIKRGIADLLRTDPGDEAFQAKIQALRETVEHHVAEEEGELFPKVERLLSAQDLELIGTAMDETQKRLRSEGNPRDAVPGETGTPAPV